MGTNNPLSLWLAYILLGATALYLDHFPVLVMSIFFKDMTTKGAVVGGFLGLITSFLGVVLSPAVWEKIFGNAPGSSLVTIDNPTAFTHPITIEFPMSLNPLPIYEYACHEGNYGMFGILSGARAVDKGVAEAAKKGSY